MFETIHTITEWWDGPRSGIANYQGIPHFFESLWRDVNGRGEDVFLLSPVDAETFQLALEAWGIWQRWETAFYQKQANLDTHPALPEDRSRHEELKQLLDVKLVIDAAHAVQKRARFRECQNQPWNGVGLMPLEIQWTEVSEVNEAMLSEEHRTD